MDERIAITGASGFIGRHLVSGIRDDRDFLNTKICRLIHHESTKDYSYYVDLNDLVKIPKNLELKFKGEDFRCDTLIHLASQTPKNMDENLMNVNVKCIEPLIQLVRPKKVIFTSSIDVYPWSWNDKITEDIPIHPDTFYGRSKQMAEVNWIKFTKIYDIKLVILRLSSIYGILDRHGRILNLIARKLIHKQSVTIFNGDQKRDFLYVDDCVSAIIKILKNFQCGIFNLGSGKSIEIGKLAELIKNYIAEKYRYKNFDIRCVTSNDRKSQRSIDLDTSFFRETYDFEPKFEIIDTLKDIINYEITRGEPSLKN